MADKQFEKLLSDFRRLNIPKNKYTIFGSGPIVVRGLRPATHDLDVLVTKEIWDLYAGKEGWVVKPCGSGKGHELVEWEDHSIELWYTWQPGEWDTRELIEDSDDIEGLNFVNLDTVLKWKRALGRDKDLIDSELIEKHLSEH